MDVRKENVERSIVHLTDTDVRLALLEFAKLRLGGTTEIEWRRDSTTGEVNGARLVHEIVTIPPGIDGAV
jgi:hypothetical protein